MSCFSPLSIFSLCSLSVFFLFVLLLLFFFSLFLPLLLPLPRLPPLLPRLPSSSCSTCFSVAAAAASSFALGCCGTSACRAAESSCASGCCGIPIAASSFTSGVCRRCGCLRSCLPSISILSISSYFSSISLSTVSEMASACCCDLPLVLHRQMCFFASSLFDLFILRQQRRRYEVTDRRLMPSPIGSFASASLQYLTLRVSTNAKSHFFFFFFFSVVASNVYRFVLTQCSEGKCVECNTVLLHHLMFRPRTPFCDWLSVAVSSQMTPRVVLFFSFLPSCALSASGMIVVSFLPRCFLQTLVHFSCATPSSPCEGSVCLPERLCLLCCFSRLSA